VRRSELHSYAYLLGNCIDERLAAKRIFRQGGHDQLVPQLPQNMAVVSGGGCILGLSSVCVLVWLW